MGRVIDMSGARVGMWRVIRVRGRDRHGQALWLCRCECGVEREVPGGRLRRGDTKSCGCAKPAALAAANTKHGHSSKGRRTPEYRAWSNMIDRCERPGNKQYADWGGRGIRVCDRWRKSFGAFLDDVGPRPSSGHSIDRIDVDGDYRPGNVRWATRYEQGRNRRNTKLSPVAACLIRHLRRRGMSYRAIGEKFGVTDQMARNVAIGKAWRDAVGDAARDATRALEVTS